MSFAQLQEEIFSAAAARGAELTAQYQRELKREEARIQEHARAIEETIIDRGRLSGKARAQRIHQSAQLAAKAQILAAKQAALAHVQAAVVQHILAWEGGPLERFISALLERVPAGGVIVPGAAHEAVVRTLAEGRGLAVEGPALPDEGGFVWRGEKGELTATVSRLVADIFTRHRAQIARTLF